jgi:hypothetical protein
MKYRALRLSRNTLDGVNENIPQGLKPDVDRVALRTAEAVPFQNHFTPGERISSKQCNLLFRRTLGVFKRVLPAVLERDVMRITHVFWLWRRLRKTLGAMRVERN